MYIHYMESLNKHKEIYKFKNLQNKNVEFYYVQMLQLED